MEDEADGFLGQHPSHSTEFKKVSLFSCRADQGILGLSVESERGDVRCRKLTGVQSQPTTTHTESREQSRL